MKIVALVLSLFILAASAFTNLTKDRCSYKPYPGTEGPLCRMAGFGYWTYDQDMNDCIGYKAYCPKGPNFFKNIDECEKECKFKNKDPCKDVPYSGKIKNMIGSVFWTYDNKKNNCFGYRAVNPKSLNLFSSLNECEKKCKPEFKREIFAFPEDNSIY